MGAAACAWPDLGKGKAMVAVFRLTMSIKRMKNPQRGASRLWRAKIQFGCFNDDFRVLLAWSRLPRPSMGRERHRPSAVG